MTSEPGETPEAPRATVRRRRRARASLQVLAVAVFGLAALGAGAWVGRKEVARFLIEDWLARRGVEAEVEVRRFELDGLVARVRAGPERAPDFEAERVEIDYRLAPPWAEGGFGVRPSEVRLIRPQLRARWADGALSFGGLDPVVREFAARPPRPDEPAPNLRVDNGLVRLATPWGPLRLHADAAAEAGRLVRLNARAAPATLEGEGLAATLDGLVVRARAKGERLDFDLRGAVTELATETLSLSESEFDLEGWIPQPGGRPDRGREPAVIRLGLRAASATVGGTVLRGAEVNGAFEGGSAGPLDALAAGGTLRVNARAEAVTGGGLDARDLRAALNASDFEIFREPQGVTWRARGEGSVRAARARQGGVFLEALSLEAPAAELAGGPAGVEGLFLARARADRLVAGDASLTRVSGDFRGESRLARGAVLHLTGALRSEGGALGTALQGVRLDAPALSLEAGSPGVTLALDAPARLVTAEGGVIRASARGGAPLLAWSQGQGRGAADLDLSGPGLPQARLAVARYGLTEGPAGLALAADVEARGVLDAGPARGLRGAASGALTFREGVLAFSPSACTPLAAERLDFGGNDVTSPSAVVCPARGPLLTLAGGEWRLAGTLREARGGVPFLEADFAEARGGFEASFGGPAGERARLSVEDARVTDAAAAPRFHPVELGGTAELNGGVWRGRFDLRRPQGGTLAGVALTHVVSTGRGSAVIDAPALTFAEGGLQPSDLTPLLEPLRLSPVVGTAEFSGRLDWSGAGVTSGGVLRTAGLDLVSGAGAVKGLTGEIRLTSLAPLVSAPGQRLTARRVDSFAPLTDADLVFELTQEAVRVETGSVLLAGGRVDFEPFVLPLDRPGAAWEGAARLQGVRLSELLEGTALGSDVRIEASVSGRVPFVMTPDGVRFSGGELVADGPGRLSIRREALVGVQAAGGAPQAPENVVQNLAYQALENLRFDVLEAKVDSLPGGRLGVLFHVVGEHDPPQRQELRLSWSDVLRRRFFDKPLPLPSGTRVDLTLDASWNFDQILEDYAAFLAARREGEAAQTARSQPVQP